VKPTRPALVAHLTVTFSLHPRSGWCQQARSRLRRPAALRQRPAAAARRAGEAPQPDAAPWAAVVLRASSEPQAVAAPPVATMLLAAAAAAQRRGPRPPRASRRHRGWRCCRRRGCRLSLLRWPRPPASTCQGRRRALRGSRRSRPRQTAAARPAPAPRKQTAPSPRTARRPRGMTARLRHRARPVLQPKAAGASWTARRPAQSCARRLRPSCHCRRQAWASGRRKHKAASPAVGDSMAGMHSQMPPIAALSAGAPPGKHRLTLANDPAPKCPRSPRPR